MKKLVSIIVLITLGISLVACSGASSTKKYTSEEVCNDLKKGLQDRWDIPDSDDEMSAEAWQEYYLRSVNAEYDILEKYKTADFENDEIKNYITEYIDILSSQKDELDKLPDAYTKSYYNYRVYNEKRIDLLKTIVGKYNIEFGNKYQSTYENLIKKESDDLLTKESECITDALSVKEIDVSAPNYGFRTIKIKVQNLTDNTFDLAQVEGRAYDKEDTVLTELYFSTKNLKPYQTIWLETTLDTDESPEDPVKLTIDNYSFSDKSSDEAYDYGTYESQTPFSKNIEKKF